MMSAINPHTLHNAAAATVAQTCDLDFARAKVELYEDEMWEALAAKRYDQACRAASRMRPFDARVKELDKLSMSNVGITDDCQTYDDGRSWYGRFGSGLVVQWFTE